MAPPGPAAARPRGPPTPTPCRRRCGRPLPANRQGRRGYAGHRARPRAPRRSCVPGGPAGPERRRRPCARRGRRQSEPSAPAPRRRSGRRRAGFPLPFGPAFFDRAAARASASAVCRAARASSSRAVARGCFCRASTSSTTPQRSSGAPRAFTSSFEGGILPGADQGTKGDLPQLPAPLGAHHRQGGALGVGRRQPRQRRSASTFTA